MTTEEEVEKFISLMEDCINKNDWQGLKKLTEELQLLMHTNHNKYRLIMDELHN